MKRRDISNSDDVIDSRDIVARIEELEEEFERQYNENQEDDTQPKVTMPAWLEMLGAAGDEDVHELRALKALAEEGEGSPDWTHGEALIRDSYFEDYARELAEDIGAVDKSAGWPARCIDWKQAAKELRQDYFSVDFDGVDYWIRA